jgi:hypothetical protein
MAEQHLSGHEPCGASTDIKRFREHFGKVRRHVKIGTLRKLLQRR